MNTETTNVVESAVAEVAAVSFKDKAVAFASNTTNQKIAGGVAVGALALWGAKKLWGRHQAKKQEAAAKTMVGDLADATESVLKTSQA